MFLKYVPTLRILRALGVPVDGARLVGYDWVCKGMEILAINIKVPTRLHRMVLEPWSWNCGLREWAKTPSVRHESKQPMNWLYCDGGTVEDAQERLSGLIRQGKGGGKEESESEDDYIDQLFTELETKVMPRYNESEARSRGLGSQGDHTDYHLKTSEFCTELENRRGRLLDMAVRKSRAENNKVKAGQYRKNKECNTQVQQELCQILGQLIKLRELALEGEQRYEGEHKDERRLAFDSLHLSLETGLDYLRPLQANLEKLVVYRLDERLSGGAEVEWIAKNLVHHNDPVWQHTVEA
ncbi:hypothetical protein EC991_007168 [Linnemannia zychae]|nr:hypothetical protein EC991_007168 [Linnemannia zychae]